MDDLLQDLIAAIHHTGFRCTFAVTGGGAGAIASLLSVPGGSRTVLEVVIPYDARSLSEYLGFSPASSCSPETASHMACRAFDRARWLAAEENLLGVACTASLRSDRPKRGDHRFHLAIQSQHGIVTQSMTLVKEARNREEEEAILDHVFLNALAEAASITSRVRVPILEGETIHTETFVNEDALSSLFEGRRKCVCIETDGRFGANSPLPKLLLPGSFNPLHRGHRALAEVASQLTGASPAFELSITNVDKPTLARQEVRRRMAPFAWLAPLWLTRTPTFVEKAEVFPECVFVVGLDTAERILETRYYGGSEQTRDQAMEFIRARGCSFLVAPRLNAQGMFMCLTDLPIPSRHRDLFASIESGQFRIDICSTELRRVCLPEPPADGRI